MAYEGLGFTPKSDLSILVQKIDEFIKEDAEKTRKLINALKDIEVKLEELEIKLRCRL